eukprot:860978-Pleurochrysis_carterae.AAC.1
MTTHSFLRRIFWLPSSSDRAALCFAVPVIITGIGKMSVSGCVFDEMVPRQLRVGGSEKWGAKERVAVHTQKVRGLLQALLD